MSTDVKNRVISESIPFINDCLGMWFRSLKFHCRMKFVSFFNEQENFLSGRVP